MLCHIIMEHWNTLQCQYVCVRVCALPRCHGALKHIAVPVCVRVRVCVCMLCHIIMEHWNTLQCKYVCVCVCVLCHIIMEHWNTLQCQYVCVRVCALPRYHGALKHIAVPVCVCACVCFATLSWSTETHCSASMCVCICVLCLVVMEHWNTLPRQQWHESMLCVCSVTCVTEHQDVASWYACCVSVLLRVSQSIKTLPVGMHVVCLFCYVCHRASRRCQLVCMSCVFSITCVTEHQDVASWYACCEHARVCVFVSGKWRGKCSGGECLSSANRSAVTGSVVTQEHYT